MSADYIDEELQIMEEDQSNSANIAAGIDIDDPISSLSLVPIESVQTGTSLQDVIELLNQKNMGCVTITDSSADNTVGIFTERDILRRVIAKDLDLGKELIDNYMTKNPELLTEDDPIEFALNRMSDGGYRHIPITRNGKVKFMLSVKDIVDQIAFTYRKKILNLPPNLKQTTSQYGG